jgi:hypothetical protein
MFTSHRSSLGCALTEPLCRTVPRLACVLARGTPRQLLDNRIVYVFPWVVLCVLVVIA